MRNSQISNRLKDLPLPEPVPNAAAFAEVRERALAFSAERRENYARYQASTRRSVDVDYLPPRLDFENASRCNFRCTMCQVSDWPKGRRAPDMAFEDFKRLIDEQIGLIEIKIQGMGEPTIQGDDFFRMIAYARAKEIWVRTATNASLLHLRNNYRKLIDSGVNEVQISVDGADAVTFERIRKSAKFDRVASNCALINGYCRELGIVRTKMWTVVQQDNRHQLPELVRLAGQIGFTNMVLCLNLTNWGDDEWQRRNDAVTVEESFTVEEGWDLVALGQDVGVDVRFWTVTDKYAVDDPASLCPWPFERGYVSSDMRIAPCCVVANPDIAELGDAHNFGQAWTSDTWRNFRQAHLEGAIPSFCRPCYR